MRFDYEQFETLTKQFHNDLVAAVVSGDDDVYDTVLKDFIDKVSDMIVDERLNSYQHGYTTSAIRFASNGQLYNLLSR